jgi:hypothetical protein
MDEIVVVAEALDLLRLAGAEGDVKFTISDGRGER